MDGHSTQTNVSATAPTAPPAAACVNGVASPERLTAGQYPASDYDDRLPADHRTPCTDSAPCAGCLAERGDAWWQGVRDRIDAAEYDGITPTPTEVMS